MARGVSIRRSSPVPSFDWKKTCSLGHETLVS